MPDPHSLRKQRLEIPLVVLVYALFAALWILLSDAAVEALVSDPSRIVDISVLKGWAFVAVTSLLLFALVRNMVNRIQAAHGREMAVLREKQRMSDLLTAIAQHSEDAIFAKDLAGRYLLFNAAASRFVGKPAEDVLGRDDRTIFPADQATMLMALDRSVIAGNRTKTSEEVLQTPQGERVFLSIKGPLRDIDDRIVGTFGISRDITARKQAEDELRRVAASLAGSEERLRLAQRSAHVGIWERNLADGSLFWTPELERLYGYAPGTFPGHYAGFARRIHPDDLPLLEKQGDEAVRKHRIFDFDFRICLPSGEIRWVNAKGGARHDGAGDPVCIYAVNIDITERKQAELALRESEAKYRNLFDGSRDAFLTIEAPEWRFVTANPAALRLFGASSEAELAQYSPWDVSPLNQPDGQYSRQKAQALVAGALRTGSVYFEWQHRRLDGREFPADVLLACVEIDGRTVLQATVRDITDRRAGEMELKVRNAELERLNRATVDREFDIIEMKKTINALSRELGREPPYPLAFLKDEPEDGLR